MRRLLPVVMMISFLGSAARAADPAAPGELTPELSTLRCLGARWAVGGDANANATVAVRYRKAGAADWQRALDLFRVQTEAIRAPLRPPAGQTLFAGSIFNLAEDTEYEVELALRNPDGGDVTRTLKMKTWAEPRLPAAGRRVAVPPGGLKDALAKAQPGDILELAPGVYTGTFTPPSGAAGQPIALVGPARGQGEAVLDGQGAANIISASGLRHFFFERLHFRNAKWAIAVNGGAFVTVRRCRFDQIDYAFVGTRTGAGQQRFFIVDNEMTGPCEWPRKKGIEEMRAVQVGGEGHVIAYNRISHFADAVDTFQAYPCRAIDIYRNEISECTDDGIELDFSDGNTRAFENRLTNVFQGISLQPIHGGPAYVVRNAIYNIGMETFKLHNSPSGALILHNTAVKLGMPLLIYTNAPVSRVMTRNNLFVGTRAAFAFETTAPMQQCDYGWDGYVGDCRQFLKWNRQRYDTPEAAAAVYPHAMKVAAKGLFATGAVAPPQTETDYIIEINELPLGAASEAVDRGQVLANINDGFAGKAPDLGAYEAGTEMLPYGPRPEAK